MFEYWPCAIKINDDGTEELISTYGSALNEEMAKDQFQIWKDWCKYDLKECWIDLYECGVYVAAKRVEM